MPGSGFAVHALAPVSQERPGLGGAEEWIGGAPSGGLRATARTASNRGAGAALRRYSAIRELLSAVVQAHRKDPRGFPRDQTLLGSGDAMRAAAGLWLPRGSGRSAIAATILDPRSCRAPARNPNGAGGTGIGRGHGFRAEPGTGGWSR